MIVDSDKLEDHIDVPIKKIVAGMALLGFRPLMSCCGFNYEGQEAGRTHLNKPYLYLDASPDHLTQQRKSFLVDICMSSYWRFDRIKSSYPILDFYAPTWEKNHPWKDSGCPHNAEMAVLAINVLEGILTKGMERYNELLPDVVTIEDGNPILYSHIKYWQYPGASEPWVVTYDDFLKL